MLTIRALELQHSLHGKTSLIQSNEKNTHKIKADMEFEAE